MLEKRKQFVSFLRMYLTTILFSALAAMETTNVDSQGSIPILSNSREELRSPNTPSHYSNFMDTKTNRDMDSLSTLRSIDTRQVEKDASSKQYEHPHTSHDHNTSSVRERNRTRHQRRNDKQHTVSNFSEPNSFSVEKENVLEQKRKKLKNLKVAPENILFEMKKDRNRPLRNRLYTKSRNKKMGLVTKKDTPGSIRVRQSTSEDTKSTSVKEIPVRKSSLDGRSRNRPHRHQYSKIGLSHKRRSRPKQPRRSRPKQPRRRPNVRRKHIRREETALPIRPNQRKSTDKTKPKTTETTQPQQRPHSNPKDKDCPTCKSNKLSEEDVRKLKLKMIYKMITEKLRLTPQEIMANRKKRPATRFPPYILRETMQDHSMDGESDGFYAKDHKVILPGEDLGRNCIVKRTSGCFTFNLAGKVRGAVASAQLWVYKTPDVNDTNTQTFLLYGLEMRPSGSFVVRNQIERHDTHVREGWVVINVTRTVTSWVRQRKADEMMAIRCATCVTRNHKAIYGAKHGYKPLIIIEYDKTSLHSRDRRSEDNCDPNFDCCRRNLEVNFREIRLTEIEAPPDMSVGYCYGHCNSITQYAYNHTMVKQRHRFTVDSLSDDMRLQLTPCCVPVVLSTAPVLVRKGSASSLEYMPNVIVERCDCV